MADHFEGQISGAVGSCWSTGGSRFSALADHAPQGTWVRAFTSSTHTYVSVLGKDASPSDYPVRETLEQAVSLLTAS